MKKIISKNERTSEMINITEALLALKICSMGGCNPPLLIHTHQGATPLMEFPPLS